MRKKKGQKGGGFMQEKLKKYGTEVLHYFLKKATELGNHEAQMVENNIQSQYPQQGGGRKTRRKNKISTHYIMARKRTRRRRRRRRRSTCRCNCKCCRRCKCKTKRRRRRRRSRRRR